MNFELLFTAHKETSLFGRYIALDTLTPLLKAYTNYFSVKVEGYSEENRKIHSITLGTGEFKILMWSQMHGNESTTTKSIFDALRFLNSKGEFQEQIHNKCTIKILPMLNPDGANRYTRNNANNVDLNRDAQAKTQKETQTLFEVFEEFKPDLCLNMHDQRSIFSAGNNSFSAVVSFLAPAADEEKQISDSRAFAMQLISFVNQKLQVLIPNHIGRYDDSFNINCVGDTFQSLGVPTILFEAGHFPGDYQRDTTRAYIFNALIYLLQAVSDPAVVLPDRKHYFSMPENKKLFFDIILRNAKFLNFSKPVDVAIQYEENLIDKKVYFLPKIQQIGDLSAFFAHQNLEAKDKLVLINQSNTIQNKQTIKELSINGEKIAMN